MATIAEEEKKKRAATGGFNPNQIPNSAPDGWAGGTGEKVSGNEFTRNMLPAAMALGPVAPVAAGMARAASAVPGIVASPVGQSALAYGVPAAGAVGLGVASADQSTPPAIANPTIRPVAQPAQANAQPAQSNVTPVAPSAPAQPAIAAEPAQGAIRRIDTPGQSPMFTNMPNDGALMARGPISAQNQAAAQSLSQRYSSGPDGSPLVNEQPQGFQPATIRHSGNDWRSANDLRNLQVSASSIFNKNGGRNGTSPAVIAYQKALETDQALKGGNDPYTTSLNRDGAAADRANTLERGAIARTAMQEAGSNVRAGMTQRLAQQKDAREESKFGMDRASAERIQSAQIALVNAKTPEEASKAHQLLNTLTGRESKTPGWKGIALQGGTDAMGNKTQSVLAAINEATGEVRRYDEGAQYNPASNGVAKPTSAAEYNALPSGTPYIKDGVTRIKP